MRVDGNAMMAGSILAMAAVVAVGLLGESGKISEFTAGAISVALLVVVPVLFSLRKKEG